MPVSILGNVVVTNFDIVDSDIPLLCGKSTMMNWNLVIDAKNETAELTLNGVSQKIELFTSEKGH